MKKKKTTGGDGNKIRKLATSFADASLVGNALGIITAEERIDYCRTMAELLYEPQTDEVQEVDDE